MRVDLDRHRTLGELVGLTFELFGRHLATFLSLTLLVVAPIVIVVDGVWGGALAHGGDAHPPSAAGLASTALGVFIIPPLVTALHVVAVQGLARGEEPTVAGAVRGAAPRLVAAVAAVALYGLVVAVGLVLLVAPGVWLGVRCYFAAQAAVVDRLGPVEALTRSAEVVKPRWWRTFGVLIVFALITAVPGAIVGAILREIHNGALYTAGYVVLEAVLLSLTAIFGTLLFFDSRARTSLPWQGTPRVDPIAPERPILPPRI
ncbi:MAG TPA: hypothetical protein VF257_12240 [Solirubrobacteraceae bacterium]